MRLTLLILLALLSGCGSARKHGAAIEVAPGSYADAFEAAKRVLVDGRFTLERVDARAGVITTVAKPTSGLATPWDGEQSSLGQEIEDLLNRQFRRVRIAFEPVDSVTGEGVPPEEDLRRGDRALRCTVAVSVERLRRPGWRVETTSVRQSSFYFDPEWQTQGAWPQYTVPFAQDHRLAARIAARITRRAAEAGAEREAAATREPRPGAPAG